MALLNLPDEPAPGVRFKITSDVDAAHEGADILYRKSWELIKVTEEEAEVETMSTENTDWSCTTERVATSQKHAVDMHCMSVDRSHEVDDEVIGGPQSVIYD